MFLKFALFSLSIMFALYVIDFYIIAKLQETNKLKKWWREHIVDEEV